MQPRINILNKKYGNWTVVKYSHAMHGDRYWLLRCSCGEERIMAKKTLIRGKLKPCECEKQSSPVNMIGKIFGRLTVLSLCTENILRKYDYVCICNCGNKKVIYYENLLTGSIKSCGCFYSQSNSKHGYASLFNGKTDEYNCWIAMKQRCNDKNTEAYQNYGSRGIKVCKRWANSFENFLNDMGLKPSKQHSIERENVNGNYEPSNCRWATTLEQSRNKRNNKTYFYKGTKLIQTDLARLLGTNSSCFSKMLKSKSFEETISFYENKNRTWGL